jgi:endonuclease/exonuclease/phosphatase family metal-dependent hydrolase
MAEPLHPRLADRAGWSLLAIVVISLVVHLTVRDSIYQLSLLYYALPLPLIAALILLAGLFWLLARYRLRPLLCLVAVIVLAGIWFPSNFRSAAPESAEAGFRVLFWNVGRGRGGWERIVEEIRSADADVIGLVEAAYHYPDPVSYWRRQLPGYVVHVAGSGLVILTRGELLESDLFVIGERSRCVTVDLIVDARRLRVVLVDLDANPFLHRGRLLERVEEIAGLFPEMPTLILGDFNTPGGSVWFGGLRSSYVNVFERAGRGMLPTWPSVLPILTLDHIWLSPHLQPVSAEKKTSLVSDHSRLWCDLAWRKSLLFPRLGRQDSSPPLPPVLG